MIRVPLSCFLVLLSATAALGQAPKPIRLWLSSAKAPTPPLRYQLLPDARILTSGDAAQVYKQVIELLAKNPVSPNSTAFGDLSEQPLHSLPREEIRKELAPCDEVFTLLDKAARCDHCEWGILERLREKGIGAALPELQSMRTCASLLAIKARLEMADGRYDQALVALRSGLALARNVGEGDTLINFLVGVAIAAIMEKQLDTFVSLADAPNLYYALAELPTPLVSMRRGMQGERVGVYGSFPGMAAVMKDLNAGNLPEEQLKKYGKIIDGLSLNDGKLGYLERIVLARNIKNRHELAKKSLIDAGRPRDKVEAMPLLQVALMHAWLEYETFIDYMNVWQSLPYWQLVERMPKPDRLTLERTLDPNKPAIPLASLVVPAIQKVALARARNDRKIALLRTIEALRLYAATHNGKLPSSLAAIKEVPVPIDPMTGNDFEYQVKNDTATLRAPPPGKDAANTSNTVVYELRLRQQKEQQP